MEELWNQHIISSSKFGNSSGRRQRPDCMFFFTASVQYTVDEDDVEEFIDHSTMSPPDYSEDFTEFALTFMNELNL